MSSVIHSVVNDAQKYMCENNLDGWLIYDYRGINPILWDILGPIPNVTRPCWLWIPAQSDPILLISYVDKGRFSDVDITCQQFVSRNEMISALEGLLISNNISRIAMEYSSNAEVPRVSRIDAGTLELVSSIGPEILSSADLFQFACQRWTDDQLQTHIVAAEKLSQIVQEAFSFIYKTLDIGVNEYQVAEFIRRRFSEEELQITDGPVVAINEHSSDPHYEPNPSSSALIRDNDWVLIDLWARQLGDDSIFSDITWVGYVGDYVPDNNKKIFDIVVEARDKALEEIYSAFSMGKRLQGWMLDRVARDYITMKGYGEYFNHRLGHSLGKDVHSHSVNLDSWETHDTRTLLPGLGVTIEPGIYLPEFGVRSEIDVYISDTGPRVTTPPQTQIVLINGK